MRRFNPGNFYCGTTAEWTSCPRPVRHPDHMSGSGSDYWYGESGVVRYSDHWGSEVASCDWYLDGVARCSFDDHDGWRCGFAPWTEFELKTFEVTVYHPDLLPSESAAALGDPVRSGVAPAWRPGMADIPYASYRVRPDMIVDGCVVVAGTYGDCGTPFDGRCLMSVDVSDWTEEERAAWTEAFPADPVFPSLPDMFGAHSVKAASHASRVLFIKDGEVFHEIYRGESSDEQLYQKISDTLTMLATGGDLRGPGGPRRRPGGTRPAPHRG